MGDRAYAVLRIIARFILRLFSPVKASGVENIPSGAAILAANHMSLTDPIKMACAIDRRVAFMAKKELFSIWGLKSLLKALGAFPVDRSGNDFSAVKQAIAILENGTLFGIFPQGTRTYKGGSQFKNGVALIAARTNVPVVPVYIDSRTRLFRTTRITFAKPLELGDILKRPTSEAMSTATQLIQTAIFACADNQNAEQKL